MTFSDALVFFGVGTFTLWGVLVVIRRLLLPKPIPGIPYRKISAQRILGDAPDVSLFSLLAGAELPPSSTKS